MKIKSTILIILFLVAVIVIFIIPSCIKDNFKFDKLSKTDYSPNIAVPLVYSSLSIQDLLTQNDHNGLITVGADKFCTLVYKGNLFSLLADSLLKMPQQTMPSMSAGLTAVQSSALAAIGTITVPYSQTVNFVSGINNPKIDSMSLKTGSLNLSLSSDFKYSGQIVMNIPGAKKNGVSFSKILPFAYTGTLPVIVNPKYDLTGYMFDMTNGGTTYNQFVVNLTVTLNGAGAPPLTTDSIRFSQSLGNMKFDKIFGDIGQLSLSPAKDTVEISVFKNALGAGTFTLANPSVKVIISNSYGVPINASIAQLDGYNPPANSYPITGSPNPLPIFSPDFTQIGQSLTGSFTLNSANSNIVSVVNNTPKDIIYKINSQTNPGGPTHTNFVIDTSRFKVDMELDLPLWGTAKDFSLMDTVKFSLDKSITDNVESALFRIYNSNGFPLDLGVQAYFTDSLYKKLDSLLISNQLILKSAAVNAATGMVVSPTQTTYDVILSKAKLANLKTTKYLLIKAVANTTNGGTTNVKIYSDYKLYFKLGVQVQVKTKI